MDSPYLPKILWYFERHQIFQRGNDVRRRSNVGTRCILSEDKYILGVDSLIIRNFTYYDQGVYYCRAFITLRNDLLTKINPVLVQLHGNSARVHLSVSNVDLELQIDFRRLATTPCRRP